MAVPRNERGLTWKQKWWSGRLMARRKARYLSALIMKHVVRELPGIGTVGVTHHGFIVVDPEWVATLSVAECAGLWVHEVLHPFLQHTTRCGHREKGRFNRAGDRVINPMVRAMGLPLPEGGCWPSDLDMPDGLLADTYYEADKPPEQPQGPAPQTGPGQGGGDQEGDDQGDGGAGEPGGGQQDPRGGGQGDAQGDEGDEGTQGPPGTPGGRQGGKAGQQSGKGGGGSGQGGGQPGSWGGRCGSGSGGEALPGEPGATDPGARSMGELHRAMKAVAEAIRKEAESGRGDIPGGLIRAADELLTPPVVPWDEKLRRAARRAVAFKLGAFDYRYDAPSRRQAGIGYGAGKPVLPRMRCPVPEVAVVVDTSGSMGAEELQQAVSETAGVMRSVGAPVSFMSCDAKVHGVQRIQDPTAIELKGGGGTSFIPAFEAIAELRPRPDIVVFLTDGMGDAPLEQPPNIHTIWVLLGPYQQVPHGGSWGGKPIEWGDIIEVPPPNGDEEAA